jgi:hypothetical protein
MSAAQDKAWEKWMAAEYSELYWQYLAARLGKFVTALNVLSGLAGASAFTLLITDYPILTKIVALLAASITLFASYSGTLPEFTKAKIRANLYSKLMARYERLWNRINQGLDEEAIYERLEILQEQEDMIPTAPDQKYDDKLRERIYKMLVESKGLPAGTTV